MLIIVWPAHPKKQNTQNMFVNFSHTLTTVGYLPTCVWSSVEAVFLFQFLEVNACANSSVSVCPNKTYTQNTPCPPFQKRRAFPVVWRGADTPYVDICSNNHSSVSVCPNKTDELTRKIPLVHHSRREGLFQWYGGAPILHKVDIC